MIYHVHLGLWGDSNPGRHVAAMVVTADGQRAVRTRDLGRLTTPQAWYEAIVWAIALMDRPDHDVLVYTRDKLCAEGPGARHDALSQALASRPRVTVRYVAKATGDTAMLEAQTIAQAAFA